LSGRLQYLKADAERQDCGGDQRAERAHARHLSTRPESRASSVLRVDVRLAGPGGGVRQYRVPRANESIRDT
jgi:hypothetical protein